MNNKQFDELLGNSVKLSYESEISGVEDLNPSFSIARLRIAYTGKNPNKTSITKEAFEDAIESMYNCPVVAHYDIKNDIIGSHDQEIVMRDGEQQLINLTNPVGVIPEFAKWDWEEVEDEDGLHTYLCSDVILWKRQAAYKKIISGDIIKQSMEITVNSGKLVGEYFEIYSFYFTAFCLLGTAQPCFESAQLFSKTAFDDSKRIFNAEYKTMLSDFKYSFGNVRETKKEEEIKEMDKKKFEKLLEKYNVKAEDLDFDYTKMDSDEAVEKAFEEAFSEAEPEVEPEVKVEVEPEIEIEVKASVTPEVKPEVKAEGSYELASNMRRSLLDQLSKEKIVDEWGYEYERYWFEDLDTAINEIYFVDTADYKLYGAPFIFDNDDVVIDFEKVKKMKYTIVPYIGSTDQGTVIDDPIEFNSLYAKHIDNLIGFINEKNNKAYTELNDKYQILVSDIEQEATKELFDRYSELLSENESYEKLVEKHDTYSLEVIEEKLNAIYGKQQANFALKDMNKVVNKVKVGEPSVNENKPYGDLMDGINNGGIK